ncbi:sensor histidine kinase [Sandaracinus amylolyticus]|uniref:sensor histidine kinase n=1 Tax=Sandaracinus amylolyticus TaxID=927083 RepID=UPI0012EEC6D1|nr:sensor histidine kinase [Sandaracinus amylolyticus]
MQDDVAPAARPRFVGAGTIIATVVVVVLAGVSGALASSTAWLPLVAVSAAYLAIATAGMAWAERSAPQRPAQMLALQVPLVVATIALSEGRAYLVAMPLVSMAVLFLRLRHAIALVVALVAVFAVIITRSLSLSGAAQATVGFASASGFVVVFSQLVRREREARAEVERLHDRLADYVTQVEELATTKERNRIAREVHDGLGHTLTVASVQLQAARTRIEDREVDERLERVQHILRDGLGELRRSVSMLRVSPSSPQAFARAIAELVEGSGAPDLAVELVTEGAPRTLPGAIGFTLYRAAQEALTNVRRHARAHRATVRLVYEPERVVLSIADDGVGADALSLGHGLTGLRERVAISGGTVEFETAAGRGLTVRVEVPA